MNLTQISIISKMAYLYGLLLPKAILINLVSLGFTSFLFVYFVAVIELTESLMPLIMVSMVALCTMYYSTGKWLGAETPNIFEPMILISPLVLIPYFVSFTLYHALPKVTEVNELIAPNIFINFISYFVLCLLFTAFVVVVLRLSVLMGDAKQETHNNINLAIAFLLNRRRLALVPYAILAAFSLSVGSLIYGAISTAILLLVVVIADIIENRGLTHEK